LTLCFSGHVFASASDKTDVADYQPVQLKRALESILPEDLRYLPMEDPKVVYWVNVDSAGNISDYLAVEATHYKLLERGEKKLLEAEFLSATRDGKSVPGKVSVTVTFYDPEQRAWKSGLMSRPMGSTLNEGTESRIYTISKDSFVYDESQPEELDKPLQLLESELCLVHEPDKPMEKGRVVVDYYVDHNGKVRIPQIISSDGDFLSLSALKTLEKTLFAPPLRKGNPTFVRVRQPFNFN